MRAEYIKLEHKFAFDFNISYESESRRRSDKIVEPGEYIEIIRKYNGTDCSSVTVHAKT